MTDLLAQWFSAQGFMPLGQCYQWMPDLLWTNAVSDALTGIAFYAIAAALLVLRRKPRDLNFNQVFVLFAVFLFACGTSRFLAIWAIWQPVYWLDAAFRALAAVATVATAVRMLPMIPKAMELPSTTKLRAVIDQLEHQIEERKKAEEALRQSQATLRELAAYQERIREDERKRIAREIHDELGQNLLVLRLDISALHARAGTRHSRLRERTAAALEYVDTTLKSIRAIMNNLRPSVLDLGLAAAIEWQVSQFERRNNVRCEAAIQDGGQAVPEAQATAVFRILQESLNNIGRHARATLVRISLSINARELEMSIADNGVGMHAGDRRKAHRFGLIGIEERVGMLGGEVRIESIPGQGTTVRLWIPLAAEAEEDVAAEA